MGDELLVRNYELGFEGLGFLVYGWQPIKLIIS
jgi:hypothetical protein